MFLKASSDICGFGSVPALADWLRAQVVPRRHKIMVPMAQWIARLDWNFILPPSLAVREERGAVWRSKQIGFARSRPAFHSAAHIDLKDHSVWFGPPTLYACSLPHAME